MTIDRNTLTPDTVVSHRSPRWASHVTDLFASLAEVEPSAAVITGVYVRVPEGMTRDEAVKVLNDNHHDAALVEAMAATLWGRGWETVQDESTRDIYRDKARAALAVVREHEATR